MEQSSSTGLELKICCYATSNKRMDFSVLKKAPFPVARKRGLGSSDKLQDVA
jgi:hypothetical protein